MFRIKRLYTFIYQTFIPVFAMTFGICLFIFIIQFLWQHIDKLVGKGLETAVIVEFFSYATLMLMPQALPLAVLLASLMTFGNLGERLELLAIKASGVSLMKIMKPMIILISLIALASFGFQDRIAPKLTVKVYSLLYSIREKSPAIDIPEGAFYSDMPGYSIYVKKKDLETGMLYDVIIYDLTRGTGVSNIAINTCDSAIIKMGDGSDYMTLTMFDGEGFQNFKQQERRYQTNVQDNVPYVRDIFKEKEVVIPFKDELERLDESRWNDSQLSKSLVQLDIAIDSMSVVVDSLNTVDRKTMSYQPAMSHREKESYADSLNVIREGIEKKELMAIAPLDFDSVMNSYSKSVHNDILSSASSEARSKSSSRVAYFHMDHGKPQIQRSIRLHRAYWHKMFTLPFACLVFFFIGAPLGAIIKKGGLGVPVIISVLLFIVYYILGNIGYKMGREGVWPAWQGEWLSSLILFPLGVFLTYKSMNESALFNVELYGRYIRKILKIQSDQNWVPVREAVAEEIVPLDSLTEVDPDRVASLRELDNNTLKDIVHNYESYKLKMEEKLWALSILKERETYFFDVRVNNYDYDYSKKLLTWFKESSRKYSIPVYIPTVLLLILSKIFPDSSIFSSLSLLSLFAYIVFFIKSTVYMSDFKKTVFVKEKGWMKFLNYILLFTLYPLHYFRLEKKMDKDLEKIRTLKY